MAEFEFLPKPESGLEVFRMCKLCLAPESSARLTRRDLAVFYCLFRACGLGPDMPESSHSWVCQYCWVRACQCVQFIECARKAEHVLNNLKDKIVTEEELKQLSVAPVQLSTFLQTIEFKSEQPHQNNHALKKDTSEIVPLDRSEDNGKKCTGQWIEVALNAKDEILDTFENDTTEWLDSEDLELQTLEHLRGAWASSKEIAESSENLSHLAGGAWVSSKRKAESRKNVRKVVKKTRRGPVKKQTHNEDRPRKESEQTLAKWRALEVELVNLTVAEQLLELEERRRSERYLAWKYKCEKCAVGYHELECIEKHMMNHDKSRGPHKCNICEIFFASARQLTAHAGKHRRRWRCLRCSEMITSNVYLVSHHAKCTSSAPVSCEQCGKLYPNKLRLRVHVSKAHTRTERYTCDICGRQFAEKTHIRYHMRTHTGEMPHQCSVCGKKSSAPSIHRHHMKVHENETKNPELYCVECNKYFKSTPILMHHLKYSLKHVSRDTYKYACTECTMRFPSSSELKIHVNTMHLNLRTYQCTQCDKAYYSRSALTAHNREQHSGKPRTKQHKCQVCSKAFATASQMRAHLKLHANDRPYVCSLCPATFNFNSALYTHCKLKHSASPAQLKKNSTCIE